MNKYWRIGTGIETYIRKFLDVYTDAHFIIGDKITLFEQEGIFYLYKANDVIHKFYSKSTSSQYIYAWMALGFIKKIMANEYVVSTYFTEYKQLVDLTKINLLAISDNEKSNRLRKTIIVNILVAAKLINTTDLRNKNVKKGSEFITTNYINNAISKYEKSIIKDKAFIKNLKEHYDREF